jgi:hypothetical protein
VEEGGYHSYVDSTSIIEGHAFVCLFFNKKKTIEDTKVLIRWRKPK